MTESLQLLSDSPLLAALIAAFVPATFALGWLLRERKAASDKEASALQVQQLTADAERLREEKSLLADQLNAERSARQDAEARASDSGLALAREQEKLSALSRQEQLLEKRLAELDSRSTQLQAQLQAKLSDVQSRLATEQEARQQEQRSADEKLAVINESREQLIKEFENLSQKIFEQKTKQFSEQSQQGISALLNPFREQLDGLKKKVEDVYVSDAKDRASLQAQIGELHKLNQQMSAEAHALTTALRGEKKKQGNWGELVLETVLEKSGLR